MLLPWCELNMSMSPVKCKCSMTSKRSTSMRASTGIPSFWPWGHSGLSCWVSGAPPHEGPFLSFKQDFQSSVASIGVKVKPCQLETFSLEKKSAGLDCEGILSIHATKPKDSWKRCSDDRVHVSIGGFALHKAGLCSLLVGECDNPSSLHEGVKDLQCWHNGKPFQFKDDCFLIFDSHAWWAAGGWGESLPFLSYATPLIPE